MVSCVDFSYLIRYVAAMNIKTEISAFLERTGRKPNHLAKAANIRVDYITRLLNGDQKDMRSENADKVRRAMAELSGSESKQPRPMG